MFYGLIGFGIVLAYIGNSGENMENLPAVAGITALLSVAILAYTFMSLPEALEDDTEIFEFLEDGYELDVETSLFGTEDEKEDGIERSVSWRPELGLRQGSDGPDGGYRIGSYSMVTEVALAALT